MRRIDALAVLAELASEHPVVVTCAATSRELAAVHDGDNQLYLLDSMGLVGSVATGLALAVGDSMPAVVGIEGDGSLLMNPNVLFTGAYLALPNLVLVVLDNGVYASTGALPTYASRLDLGAVAAAAGWTVARAETADGLRDAFADLVGGGSSGFLHVRIERGNAPDVPKLLADPVVLADRFARWLQRSRTGSTSGR